MQPDLNQPKKPEQAALAGPEQVVKNTEVPQAPPAETPASPPPQTPPPVTPQAPPAQAATTTPPPAQTSTVDPAIAQFPAEDVDTIEKVWVEKHDQIINEKKDDPYAEDEAQHDLSRAYIKKRFNLDIK